MPWLRLAAIVPAAVAARMRRVERRTLGRLREAGATRPERAVLLGAHGRAGALVYRRLERAGALVAAGNDRYYLSEAAYAAFCRRRRRRAFVVFAVLLALVAALFFRGDLSP